MFEPYRPPHPAGAGRPALRRACVGRMRGIHSAVPVSNAEPGGRRGPGRPRNVLHDDAIMLAVRELLDEAGYAALTIDAVAVRAGVGRPTVYRRWPSKAALVIAALGESSLRRDPLPDAGHLREDLLAIRQRQLALLNSSEGLRVLPGLAADVVERTELHSRFYDRYVGPWRDIIRAAVDRAVSRGEITGGASVGLVADLITGPLVFRVIFAHEVPTEMALEPAVDLVLAGLEHQSAVG